MSPFIHIDTALIAQEASIDIGLMLMGNPDDVTAMRRMALILSDLIGAGAKSQEERPEIEPAAFLILNAAITKAGIISPTLGELLSEVEEVIVLLSADDPMGKPRWIVKQMQTFCRALSAEIVRECANRRNLR